MYELTEYSKKMDVSSYDYVFKKFSDFYGIADCLTVGLFGEFKVLIISDKTEDILDFLDKSEEYKDLLVTIASGENAISYVVGLKPTTVIKGRQSMFSYFETKIIEKNLYFGKYVASKLYNSIEQDKVTIDETLDMCHEKFGELNLISEKELSKYILLQDIVYPRQVLLKFIRMDRYRWSSLKKCMQQIDNDVIVGAIVKNLKNLVQSKAKYLRTGINDKRIKELNADNIMLLYRIFVLERSGMNDVYVLFKLYEMGTSAQEMKESTEDVTF